MSLPDPIIGKKLGDYTVQELLGRGGMARVYKGYDENLDRYAAVKVITSDYVATADEAEYKQRFQREARSIARLRHPNIVGIYQFGDFEGLYYMAMVFLDGEDLRVRLKQAAEAGQRMPIEDVLKMTREVASALDYAHSQGVIHRDIKPSNIMMTSTGAVLTDFGLALNTSEGTMGDTFGSAYYIAPEQAISSARAVPQSDLYSLGVVLYEAFAGQVPFDDPSVMSVALKHLNEPPPPPTKYNPELPAGIEKVLLKLLAKEPKDRFQSGEELVSALERAVGSDWEDTVELMAPAPLGGAEDSIDTQEMSQPSSQAAAHTAETAQIATGQREPEPAADTLPPAKTQEQHARPETRNNTGLLVGGGFLLLLIAIIAGVLLLGGGGDDGGNGDGGEDSAALAENDTATALGIASLTAEAIAARPSATPTVALTETDVPTDTSEPADTPTVAVTDTVAPTDTPSPSTSTPEPEPTETPQPPSNTPEPSNTPRLPTDTPQPSDTPEGGGGLVVDGTAEPEPEPQFQLRYTTERIVLENISAETQDISGLVFAGDEIGRFAATDWRSTLRPAGGSPERFRASGCVQLVTTQEAAIDTGCQRYNVWLWQSSEDTHFWIENEGNTAFVVEQDGEPIAECPLATRRASETICEFALPSAEPAEEAVSDRPTRTPTRRPTATSRPTDTATPAAPPEIQLRYSSERIVLENISNRTQNISALVFEGDGDTRFAATEWITVMRDVGGSLAGFQSQGCVQLTIARSAAIDPGCLRYNVWTWDAAEDAHFWIESADNTEFVVRRNGVVIAECPAVAGSQTELTCEFALP